MRKYGEKKFLLNIFLIFFIFLSFTVKALDLWFVEGAVSKQFEESFKESNPETSGIWVVAAYYNIIQLISQNIEEYLKDPFTFQSQLANKCVTKGAFNVKNCIIKDSEDTYLDTELNITRIHNGRFYRNPIS